MKMAVIGLGLIGGSMALSLRKSGLVHSIVGCDIREQHARTALTLGLVDEVRDIDGLVENVDLVVVAVPVDAAPMIVFEVLERAHQHVVMDVGSTKESIVLAVQEHRNRGRFVATHPMWGTEHSGPEVAIATGFTGRTVVLCNGAESDSDSIEIVKRVYAALGMRVVEMSAAEHDLHAAYISHLSHIASFALANTVIEKEQREETLFALASAGFESMVRLAASSPTTWIPIFQQNNKHLTTALQEYIVQLQYFYQCLEHSNSGDLHGFLRKANAIHGVLEQSRRDAFPNKNNNE